MDQEPALQITSFVVRFVHQEPGEPADELAPAPSRFRGSIRHVQSDEEISFTHWQDAVNFMQRFLPTPLEEE